LLGGSRDESTSEFLGITKLGQFYKMIVLFFYYKMTMGYNAIHGVEITGVDPLAVNALRYIIHTK
jgi:hypothetical protein